jgi:hypothetical protein
MNMQSPDLNFFLEETPDAQRAQVDWLTREIGLDSAFFDKLLDTDEATFSSWREVRGPLPPHGKEILRELWRLMLHLLSHQGSDLSRLRALLYETMPTCPWGKHPGLPPWSGTSLKSYLEQTRADGIDKVGYWVEGLRFGNPYAG